MGELTVLFGQAGAGDAQAFDRIFTLLYPDLEAMARSRLRRGERVTMADTGALVHESWLRLQQAGTLDTAFGKAVAAADPDVLDVAECTVWRDWEKARAYLTVALKR